MENVGEMANHDRHASKPAKSLESQVLIVFQFI
ncbi:hypothetical protein DM82_6007 [Burkholderia oklahomensis]|uniref:Uncharacterized protein n=1 Tax=Burkholderia oklahomensis TaxID=342113 RepID=A0AAI8FR61_9BURK|nr:hypothetical protein DM82_6007 [Burkholderia oklahomensis]